jgi:SAM-dependent methyltransferase
MPLPSEFDNQNAPIQAAFRDEFIDKLSATYFVGRENETWLEIGPQYRDRIRALFPKNKILTLDIVDTYKPDIIGDITKFNGHIPDNHFDIVFCMEVLEHVVDPFASISEIRRILKNDGYLVLSTPLNARIHGPIPDCWRFTEFGLRVLLRNFDLIAINKLETPDRTLFPMSYTVLARNNSNKDIDPREMQFERIS